MNFLSWQKKIKILLIFFIITGCQSLKSRHDLKNVKSVAKAPVADKIATAPPPSVSNSSQPEEDNIPELTTEEPSPSLTPAVLPPPPPIPEIPKIAIILGAGGAKTYAHIGFLHEVSREKLPIYAVGGIEFAAPIAALYANKEQVNEVEWQMFKLKLEDLTKRNLLGVREFNIDLSAIKNFLSTTFHRIRIDEFRLQFACPSLNLKMNQVYLMNRGGLEQVLSLCLAYPPYFKPYQDSLAGVREVTALANYLRSKGSNHIVFINVLEVPEGSRSYVSEKHSTDNILWSEVAAAYNRPIQGVDTIIYLDTGGYSIMDFDKRREIMNKGSVAATRQIKILMRKLGL